MSQSNKNIATQKLIVKSTTQSIESMRLEEIASQEHQLSLFDDAPIPQIAMDVVSAKKRSAKLKPLAPVTRPLRICIAGYRSAPFGWRPRHLY